jgi:hypothetical protein
VEKGISFAISGVSCGYMAKAITKGAEMCEKCEITHDV